MDVRKCKELIEEYKATQDMYIFFNKLKWQVGYVLIGAIAVATGLFFSGAQANSKGFSFLFFFSLILMTTWCIYGERCTLLYFSGNLTEKISDKYKEARTVFEKSF